MRHRSSLTHPMRRSGVVAAILAVMFSPWLPQRPAAAWEVSTHQRMTKYAAQRSRSLTEFYRSAGVDENERLRSESLAAMLESGMDDGGQSPTSAMTDAVQDFTGEEGVAATPSNMLRLGSILEDGGTRYCNHFYEPDFLTPEGPIKGLPLTLSEGGLLDVANRHFYCTSGVNDATKWMMMDLAGNRWGWTGALSGVYDGLCLSSKAERTNRLAEGLASLGHVLHLVQDMAQPSHVRNDSHGCKFTPLEVPTPDGCSELEIWGDKPAGRGQLDAIGIRMAQNLYPTLLSPPGVGIAPRRAAHKLAVFATTHFFSDNTIAVAPPASPAIMGVGYERLEGAPGGFYLTEAVPDALEAGYAPVVHIAYSPPPIPPCQPRNARTWSDYAPCTALSLNDPKGLIAGQEVGQLFPRAIEESRNVLEFFFRGNIEVTEARSTSAAADGTQSLVVEVRDLTRWDQFVDEDGPVDAAARHLDLTPSRWKVFSEDEVTGALLAANVDGVRRLPPASGCGGASQGDRFELRVSGWKPAAQASTQAVGETPAEDAPAPPRTRSGYPDGETPSYSLDEADILAGSSQLVQEISNSVPELVAQLNGRGSTTFQSPELNNAIQFASGIAGQIIGGAGKVRVVYCGPIGATDGIAVGHAPVASLRPLAGMHAGSASQLFKFVPAAQPGPWDVVALPGNGTASGAPLRLDTSNGDGATSGSAEYSDCRGRINGSVRGKASISIAEVRTVILNPGEKLTISTAYAGVATPATATPAARTNSAASRSLNPGSRTASAPSRSGVAAASPSDPAAPRRRYGETASAPMPRALETPSPPGLADEPSPEAPKSPPPTVGAELNVALMPAEMLCAARYGASASTGDGGAATEEEDPALPVTLTYEDVAARLAGFLDQKIDGKLGPALAGLVSSISAENGITLTREQLSAINGINGATLVSRGPIPVVIHCRAYASSSGELDDGAVGEIVFSWSVKKTGPCAPPCPE